MRYISELENGRELTVENEGEQTHLSISSSDPGQQQSQGNSFTTGKWSKAPELHRSGKSIIVQLHTKSGDKFLRVQGGQMRQLDDEPDLSKTNRLELSKSSARSSGRMQPMEPMKPMRGMKPMEPMKPMKPMKMEMGGMKMSMGREEERSRTKAGFCTQCGSELGKQDRFCGRCGAKAG